MADTCNAANAMFDGGIRPAADGDRARTRSQDAIAFSLDHAGARAAVTALSDIPQDAWADLAGRAIEPNAYFLPAWARAVNAHARGRAGAMALAAWDAGSDHRLVGLLPVVSAWRAYRLPLPFLVSYEAYGVLGTPLIDRDRAGEAAVALIGAARARGTHALLLRDIPADGAAMSAIRGVLAREGLRPCAVRRYQRSLLEAPAAAVSPDGPVAEAFPSDVDMAGLMPKSLMSKSLRRMRARLAGRGPVSLTLARAPDEVSSALEEFLALEAGGWKGKRGTALASSEGDAAFIREAGPALAATGNCEIAVLRCGGTPVAAGILPRHLDRGYFFKIGIDERFLQASPGTQLMAEVTHHFRADPGIAFADSTEPSANGPISALWSGRMRMADMLVPVHARDPLFPVIRAALLTRAALRGLLHLVAAWARE